MRRLLFWTALQAHSSQAAIVILGLPPMQRFPLLPQPLPLKFEARSQDFSGDGYHPSEQSYAVLGLWVADAILAQLAN